MFSASQQEHRSSFGMPSDSFSATSPAVHSPSQYLPEFLLGDMTSSSTSPIHSHHRLWSSNAGDTVKSRSHVSIGSSTRFASNNSPSHPTSSTIASPSIKLGRPINEKHGGPPILGLFEQDHVPSPLSQSSNLPLPMFSSPASTSTMSVPLGEGCTLHNSLFNKSNLNSSLLSPAQLDPFYTQGELLKPDEDLDETWVTVFGFPSSAVSYILQEFSLYGNILEHKISGCNNWVHIHYQSRIQAKKALAKNGKIFAGNMMIGVQPCIDKNIMNTSTAKDNVFAASPLSFTIPSERSFNETSKTLGIRPLTQAYRTAASNHEVAPNSYTPQKKNSVVTKAMEYVLGW